VRPVNGAIIVDNSIASRTRYSLALFFPHSKGGKKSSENLSKWDFEWESRIRAELKILKEFTSKAIRLSIAL
jgi:hypothetical protein